MKVIDVYDSNSDLKSYGKNIFTTTINYLKKFPSEYSRCFLNNLKTLELIKVNTIDGVMTARYNTYENIIEFSNANALGHELFHMASNDLKSGLYAFESKMNIESGLIEGMTEYSCMKAYYLKYPRSYPFEVFTVMMLEDIPNIFRPYFVPSNRDLINLFPNRKDIYGLLYSLDAYNKIMLDYITSTYTDEDILIDIQEFAESVKYTIINLINIELSFEKDKEKLKAYRDKFMDLISSKWVYSNITEIYPNYLDMVNKEINKRIKRRR